MHQKGQSYFVKSVVLLRQLISIYNHERTTALPMLTKLRLLPVSVHDLVCHASFLEGQPNLESMPMSILPFERSFSFHILRHSHSVSEGEERSRDAPPNIGTPQRSKCPFVPWDSNAPTACDGRCVR